MSVAVIIAARDAEATIGRAVKSALAQPQASQVIVIDDGSADRTSAAAGIAAEGSERLVVRRLATSGGPSRARNVALALARTPYVCILDADDFMLPGRLAGLTARLGDCDMVADDLLRVEEGAEEGFGAPMLGLAEDLELTLPEFIERNISRPDAERAELGFLKPLIRRDFLARHTLAYDERVRLGEDFLFYAAALQRGAKFRVTPACGYMSVERPGSLSRAHTYEDLRALLEGAEDLAARGLDDEAAAAMGAWRAHLTRKLHHREVLAARREDGMLGALKALTRSPATAGYVLARTLNDKLARARGQSA